MPRATFALVSCFVALAAPTEAVVSGGGSPVSDCFVVLEGVTGTDDGGPRQNLPCSVAGIMTDGAAGYKVSPDCPPSTESLAAIAVADVSFTTGTSTLAAPVRARGRTAHASPTTPVERTDAAEAASAPSTTVSGLDGSAAVVLPVHAEWLP